MAAAWSPSWGGEEEKGRREGGEDLGICQLGVKEGKGERGGGVGICQLGRGRRAGGEGGSWEFRGDVGIPVAPPGRTVPSCQPRPSPCYPRPTLSCVNPRLKCDLKCVGSSAMAAPYSEAAARRSPRCRAA